MIVTIDGPAGAGKSTVARALAQRLGYHFLDTGAMYRAVALAGLRRGIDWADPVTLARVAEVIQLEYAGDRIRLDGEDVSEAIRTSEVTAVTRHAADHPKVRARLVELQRREALGRNLVTEGRDQGTVVFPQAECKIFLTASAEERARRRLEEIHARGEMVSLDEILMRQNRRDQEDTGRAIAPLVPAADAIQVNTDGLSAAEVVDRLEAIVRGIEQAANPNRVSPACQEN